MERQSQGPTAAPDLATQDRFGTRHTGLRHATSQLHEDTDRFTMSAGFFDTSSRFADYLRRMSGFYDAYARAVAGHDPHGWASRWQIDSHGRWIRQELEQLDSAPRLMPRAGLELPSASSVLGSLYVLAGSTVGARMLNRMCVDRGIPQPGGSHYLAASARSLRWSDFLSFLEIAPIASERQMIDGARATFVCVQQHLMAPEASS